MTPPENDRPDDEDGGTFKLKPGGAPGPAAPSPAAGPGDEDNLDRTMKIQRGAVPPAPTTPPPPASPLGNPTGPAEPPAAAFAETTVMPQQSGSQTGFQPSGQQPPQPQQGPLGPTPQSPGPQQYGQPGPQGQPGGYPPQAQQQPGFPQPQQAPAAGEAPEGIKRIGLMAIVGSAIGLLTSIIVLSVLGGFAIATAPLSILFALALGWYGYALPRGQIGSNGLRLTGIILMMIAAGGAVLGLFSSFNTIAVFGGLGVISLIQSILLAGAYGYASFIYIKDDASKAYIKGAPAAGYPQQGGYPQPGQQQYGQPGPQGQPGGYPPPPPGYQGQQPPQGPYGR